MRKCLSVVDKISCEPNTGYAGYVKTKRKLKTLDAAWHLVLQYGNKS